MLNNYQAILFSLLFFCFSTVTSIAGDLEDAKCAFQNKEYDKALVIATPLAEKGDPMAQTILGGIHRFGFGVEQDNEVAAKWFRKAADQGNAEAQFNLGIMYKYGQGFKHDSVEAVRWYRKAAEQGFWMAQFGLGVFYELGDGVKQDYVEAVKWYRKAAEQGIVWGQINLGKMYESGKGVEQDNEEAINMFYEAGQSYLKMGHREGALSALEHITNLNPNHPLGKTLNAQIHGEEAEDMKSLPGTGNENTSKQHR